MNLGDPPDRPNVAQLPVKFKKPAPEDRTVLHLHEVGRSGCMHLFVSYLVDESAAEVECSKCGAKLNPMWVLSRLATEDRRMREAASRYQDELKRLKERSRTKCMHCRKMTLISDR